MLVATPSRLLARVCRSLSRGGMALWVTLWLAQTVHGAMPDLSTTVEMQDSLQLTTDVFFPHGDGPWPAALHRTPYGRSTQWGNASAFTDRGTVFVVQDIRGGVISGDQWVPFLDDGWGANQDGYDTVQWIAGQSWSNGDVLMDGYSASAITGLLAAGAAPPALRGVQANTGAGNIYRDVAFPGGPFRRSLVEGYLEQVNNLGVIDEVVAHARRDSFWDPVDLTMRFSVVDVPILQVSGWFDMYVNAGFDSLLGIDALGVGNARGRQILIVGPWTHGRIGQREQGDLIYPENALFPNGLGVMITQFTEAVIRGGSPEVFDEPRINYYLMGDVDDPEAPGNEWLTAESWPPPHEMTALYLHGNGALSEAAPLATESPSTSYVSDPQSSIPTVGGANLFTSNGPRNQALLLLRSDLLYFITDVMPRPRSVIGPITARLFVSSTAPDADFLVKLCDVYPDGRVILMAEGAVQARRRNGEDQEDLMVPGEICSLDIDLGQLALSFNTGHRCAIIIASSNDPRFEVNPQTGAPLMLDDPVTQIATHTIHHSPAYPSAISLPISNEFLMDTVPQGLGLR
ncbi:CocE/NonD family hydrolase [Candidatus Sumerlaeota bacterium]|nr:CocE/NonD family hydrolase [Candidatus Sumerlaeota bacterium]